MNKYIKIILLIFVLNFLWEISQATLYRPHFKEGIDFLFVHLRAAGGDALLFLFIYLLGVPFFHDRKWFARGLITGYAFVLITGVALAVILEKIALDSGRWAYREAMPIMPVLEVGLTPLAQLVVLPVLVAYFSKTILFSFRKQ